MTGVRAGTVYFGEQLLLAQSEEGGLEEGGAEPQFSLLEVMDSLYKRAEDHGMLNQILQMISHYNVLEVMEFATLADEPELYEVSCGVKESGSWTSLESRRLARLVSSLGARRLLSVV